MLLNLLSLITLYGVLIADVSSEAETTSAVGSSYFRNNIQYHVMETQIPRDTFRQVSRADATAKHELVFAVPQMNLSLIESMLMERSSPDNALYQQWLSFDEIGSLVRNTASAEAVRNWLMLCDVDITWISRHSTYIKAVTTIGEWEKMLDTVFYAWEDVSKSGSFTKKDRMMHRALSFSLPTYIKDHVSAVFNTVQTPPEFRPKYKLKSGNSNTPFKTYLRGLFQTQSSSGAVTVSFLNNLYGISSNIGSSAIKQSVFETNYEEYSTNDLTRFQKKYGLTVQSAIEKNGYEVAECSSSNSCTEGNLDVQYIMGVAQETTTIYWYTGVGDSFLTWILDVSDEEYPPSSNSISWGANERFVAASTFETFNNEAMKLGVQGVTIIVSSGDNGAAGASGDCDKVSGSSQFKWKYGTTWSGKGYFPSFPATSPYVTAVGATMGPESGGSEIACQSQLGGVITSGGGFSTIFRTPSYQQKSISAYFNNLTASYAPTAGYNSKGRGYPDIAFIGVNYQVYIQGSIYSLYGTSASAPVLAAMVSLINAERLKNNQSSVGFLNPTLYAYGYGGSYFGKAWNPFKGVYPFTDITSGHNKCTVNECCQSGFFTSEYWDPVTGLGSISLGSLGELIGTSIPSTSTSNDDYITGNRKIIKIKLLWIIISLIATIIFSSALVYGVTRLIILLCFGRRTLVNSSNTVAVPTEIEVPPSALFEDVQFDNFGNPMVSDVPPAAFSPGRASHFPSTIALPPTREVAFTSISQNQY